MHGKSSIGAHVLAIRGARGLLTALWDALLSARFSQSGPIVPTSGDSRFCAGRAPRLVGDHVRA